MITYIFRMGLFLLIVILSACSEYHPFIGKSTDAPLLIGEAHKGWIKYQIYAVPTDNYISTNHNYTSHLVIRIINTDKDGASPLRRICSNLDDYNSRYEYLLNRAKDDIVLMTSKKVLYPVYYAFENNYNVLPFETINVGYTITEKRPTQYELMFTDRIFAQDTVGFKLK